MSKCGGKRCTTHKQLIVGNLFHFKSSNYSFKVKHDMDCNSKFVLYVLTVCVQDVGKIILVKLRLNYVKG